MKLQIRYCTSWGYLPRAVSVTEMFNNKFGNKVESELIPSSGGVFEITLDGKLVYSKQKTGRFPDKKDIEEIMASIET